MFIPVSVFLESRLGWGVLFPDPGSLSICSSLLGLMLHFFPSISAPSIMEPRSPLNSLSLSLLSLFLPLPVLLSLLSTLVLVIPFVSLWHLWSLSNFAVDARAGPFDTGNRIQLYCAPMQSASWIAIEDWSQATIFLTATVAGILCGLLSCWVVVYLLPSNTEDPIVLTRVE